jgi:hypothetical protein
MEDDASFTAVCNDLESSTRDGMSASKPNNDQTEIRTLNIFRSSSGECKIRCARFELRGLEIERASSILYRNDSGIEKGIRWALGGLLKQLDWSLTPLFGIV